ncbi:MAG: phosphoribosylamine--glycine ligase [Candidatus Xenolissoclinum pacificiensis L6]|uniref:phosphoribosylamine--glycine ligase n=1 Tax=Candidatus Xenolissoclinum pacificiensis L6 TaxID=1401685 RepID=W2V1T3_9RICK|nr:MAG: phosphoribosylamine--glycine ligase [Candidatus Xenolissoclinum pacificiensis L6]
MSKCWVMNVRYKVLVIGTGGREYSLMDAFSKSPIADKIFTNNINFSHKALYIDINYDSEMEYIAYHCKDKNIDLVVIGDEKYLENGLTDILQSEGILVFGPNKAASKLEFSKSYAKELCHIHSIPTAQNGYFTDLKSATAFIDTLKTEKVVIKADGLCSGKGVFICDSHQEGIKISEEMFAGKLGSSGKTVVIEEYLQGYEVSFFVLFDGTNCLELGHVQDHKQVDHEGKILNTGGMGGFSPVDLCNEETRTTIMRDIIYPTFYALADADIRYVGVLFAGIMMTRSNDGTYFPKLLEYNVRFGDPETQMLLPRLEVDLLDLCVKTAMGKISPTQEIKLKENKYTFCIVIASQGYPGNYKKGIEITGIDEVQKHKDVHLYFANIKYENGIYKSTGGRILNLVVLADSLVEARERAYSLVTLIKGDGIFYLENM